MNSNDSRPSGCRWRLILLGALLATAIPPTVAAPPSASIIELSPGSAEALHFDGEVGSVVVAEPQTADVTALDNRNLLVMGQRPGITSVKIYATDGQLLAVYSIRVNVHSEHAQAVVSQIAGKGAQIEVRPVGNTLVVSGVAKSPSEAERLLRGLRSVAGETPIIDAINLDSPAQVNLEVLISEVSRNVSQELGIDWSVDINPFEDPLRTWITGTGVRLGTGALTVANVLEQDVLFYEQFRNERGEIETADEARFVNSVRELAVVNPQRGGQGGIVLSHSELLHGDKYRATVFLEALAENGLAVVHARPNLTTVSGQPAEFFSGLEIPVPTITDRGLIGTEYTQTGISLNFTPTVLDADHISLKVEPSIRELAAGGTTIAGTAVPNINERSASTTVELGDGETIAIAGLYRRSNTSSEAGIPLLKDIPIWGALFRNFAEREQSVEMIIVVTPRIVAALPESPRTLDLALDAGDTALQFANEFYY